MSKIETRNVCCIAMSHIKESTILGYRLGDAPLPFLGNFMGPEMLIVHCHSESYVGDRPMEIPGSIWDCLVWGRAKGFDYIIFDRDLDPFEDGTEGLAAYEGEILMPPPSVKRDYKPGDLVLTKLSGPAAEAAKAYQDAVADKPADLRDHDAFHAWTDRVDAARQVYLDATAAPGASVTMEASA